jgi:hypothetical protein
MRFVRTLLVLLLPLLSFSVFGQNLTVAWPTHEQVRLVEVVVFRYHQAPESHLFQEGLLQDPQSETLLPSAAIQWFKDHNQRTPKHQGYLSWIEAVALNQIETSPIGPTKPVRQTTPQLNFPLLGHQLVAHSEDLNRALSRLATSTKLEVIDARAWHQSLSTNAKGINFTDSCSTSTLSTRHPRTIWSWEQFANTCSEAQSVLGGVIQITKRQFLIADVSMAWHMPASSVHGPLRRAFLLGLGYSVDQLVERRSIQEGVWNYFDSKAMGVLVRVSQLPTDS